MRPLRALPVIALLSFLASACDPRPEDPGLAAEPGSITEEFDLWAAEHAHPLVADLEGPLADIDLASFASLRQIVGDARIVAIGEPFHGGHEPLVFRNLLIRYLVAELGFTAVALETGLSPSKRIYDHVLLRTDEPDSVLAASFSYGFGNYRENLELLHWLRRYNAERAPSDRVRFYGVDIAGHVFPPGYPSPYGLLAYLEEADGALAEDVRAQLSGITEHLLVDRFIELPQAEQDRIAVQIEDLITLVRRRRNDLTAVTSRDEYDWALRQTLNAGWDVGYMRSAPPEFVALYVAGADVVPDPREMLAFIEVREAAIAENVGWVLQREGAAGRVAFFAHNIHVQTQPLDAPLGQGLISMLDGGQYSGTYLHSMLADDLVVIGVLFGETEGFPAETGPLPRDGLEAFLQGPGTGPYMFDLRRLPAGSALEDWFQRGHIVRDASLGEYVVEPLQAYDVILYIDRVTPARR
jgi:erythromycin esterase